MTSIQQNLNKQILQNLFCPVSSRTPGYRFNAMSASIRSTFVHYSFNLRYKYIVGISWLYPAFVLVSYYKHAIQPIWTGASFILHPGFGSPSLSPSLSGFYRFRLIQSTIVVNIFDRSLGYFMDWLAKYLEIFSSSGCHYPAFG
jgi:hypothetical protein